MAQRDPREHLPQVDEEWLETLRNNPRVIHHRQQTTDPYVQRIIITEPVDELWLIGRREDESEEDGAD